MTSPMRTTSLLSRLLPKRSHWAAMTIITSLLLLTIYVITKNSEDYTTAERFVEQDIRIAAAIGKPQQVSFMFWSGFESSGGIGGHAEYTFNATTDNGVFVVKVSLRNTAGAWRVNSVDIRGRRGILTHIVVDYPISSRIPSEYYVARNTPIHRTRDSLFRGVNAIACFQR